jgi:hypothetical protein
LQSFYLTESSKSVLEEKPFRCVADGAELRTFDSIGDRSRNVIPLDFVFTNGSSADLVFTAVDVVVKNVDIIAGISSGVVGPQHQYELKIKDEPGMQSFALTPNFKISGNDTSGFTLAFTPIDALYPRCWTMNLVFKTNQGSIRSEDFSLIMATGRKRAPS